MAEEKDKPQKSKEDFFKLAQLLLAGVGIFAALCYFLGRLHIEAYYYALGITPHVLHFAPEDYMFSSFDLIIMCLFICFWLYMYYGFIKTGEKLLFGFPIFRSSTKLGLVNNILMMVLTFFLAVSTFLNIYLGKSIGSNVPGLIGLSIGFSIGVVAILFLWCLEIFWGKRAIYLEFCVIGLMLLAYLPYTVTFVAKTQAKSDIEKFPQAVLICEDVLPSQLQSSLDTPERSTEVKIITTNNGMTYILQQNSKSTNEWQIYAIPQDDIKQIIYLHGK
ncbi:MAG TPA: hypothetical protein VGA82_06565 [Dehalococcoidales bacterium]